MQMTLDLDKNFDWNDFLINFIPDKLFNYVVLNLNEDKATALNDYLLDNLQIKSTVLEILEYAIRNMFLSNSSRGFVLMIDTVRNVPNSSQNLLKTVKLLDFGNLEIKGLNVLSAGFDYIVMQIHNLVTVYRRMRGEL